MLRNIRHLVQQTGTWTEVTTLVIPGVNDGDDELCAIADFLADISLDIPWHVSGFTPHYQMRDRPPTPPATLRRAWEIGRAAGLRYVYTGNIWGSRQLAWLQQHLLPALRDDPDRARRLPRPPALVGTGPMPHVRRSDCREVEMTVQAVTPREPAHAGDAYIRQPAVAGRFYPANGATLAGEVQRLLAAGRALRTGPCACAGCPPRRLRLQRRSRRRRLSDIGRFSHQ